MKERVEKTSHAIIRSCREEKKKKRGEATIKQILEENIPELREGLRLQIERAHKRSRK